MIVTILSNQEVSFFFFKKNNAFSKFSVKIPCLNKKIIFFKQLKRKLMHDLGIWNPHCLGR